MTAQIPLEAWPIGLEAQAVHLALDPAQIHRRSKLDFARARDSLDDFDAAVVDLGDGKSFALQHYVNAPEPGTILVLKAGTADGLAEALGMLKVKPGEVLWVAPDLKDDLDTILASKRPRRAAALAAGLAIGVGASVLARRHKRRARPAS